MKIAIPVKTNKEDTAVATLFGLAKWFAIVEDSQITIEKNPAENGRAVIEWLNEIDVDTIIIQEMGEGPCGMIQKLGNIKVYHSGYDRILLVDVLKKFQENTLPLLDDIGMAKIVEHHEARHSHGHHQH